MAGYSDTEISQILVARALNSSGPGTHTSAFQGALSNTVSSVVAIGSYARNTVFTLKNDLVVIFDHTAQASSRIGAAIMLVFKLAVISVLAFAGWQEWRQHIISATEIAESQVRKIRAEECIARVESAAKNMRASDVLNGIYQGNDELARDCDPNYAHRKAMEAECSKKFNVLLDVISTMPADEFKAKLADHKSTCSISDADRATAKLKFEAHEREQKKTVAELVARMQAATKAEEHYVAGRYEEAYKIANDNMIATEAFETRLKQEPSDLTAIDLSQLSWYALCAHEFKRALDASERSLKIKPRLGPETNRAHALMLLGRLDEAKVIYLAHKGKPVNDTTWDKLILGDFGKLRKAGITHPMMAKIEEELASASAEPVPNTRGPAALSQPVLARSSTPQNPRLAVSSDQLTLRKAADKTAEAIVLLNKGAQVEVLATDTNGWSQVQLSDAGTSVTGYVNGRYLTQDLSASPKPVILTEPPNFDKPAFCGHETKPIELVVCSNEDLAYLDGAMGKVYQILLAKDQDPNALTRSQTQWTNERRRNCNIPSTGRLAGPITSNMIQCVMSMTAARARDLRAGRY
jgi:uncharacterized protein YecT (DUF1311 family)/uncharacterized protein YgiM (DUF1202 family)